MSYPKSPVVLPAWDRLKHGLLLKGAEIPLAGWLFKADRESISSNLKHRSYSWFLCEVLIPSVYETVHKKVSNSRWTLKKRFFFGGRIHSPLKSCCRLWALGQDVSLTTDLIKPNVSLLESCKSPWSCNRLWFRFFNRFCKREQCLAFATLTAFIRSDIKHVGWEKSKTLWGKEQVQV